MHLYAVDSSGKLMEAKRASKQRDYYCLECHGVVRRRSGIHRTAHFYHLNPPDSCRQQGKSLTHLQVQFAILSLLPSGEATMEHAFPAVRRIADVAWLPQKIIFEIQCSPISPEEIEARQRDYHSQGFQVVWILHDLRYNQLRLSAAENFLQPFPHYFTNIDAEGYGEIYDQLSRIENGMRKVKSAPFSLDLSQPMAAHSEPPLSASHPRHRWPLFFAGDGRHHYVLGATDLEVFFEDSLKSQTFLSRLQGPLRIAGFYLLRPYDLIFKMLLEKACK